MRKLFLFLIIAVFPLLLEAQHTVNDIGDDGWFKVRFEVVQSGKILYTIDQCYPSGEEYRVPDADKAKLPLALKIVCLGVFEEQFGNIEFDEIPWQDYAGFNVRPAGFSATMDFKLSRPEEEILAELGEETVNEYKDREW